MIDKKCSTFTTTITDACKKDLGNDDKFYDGKWTVRVIDYRERTVELAKNGRSIIRTFDEVNEIIEE